MFRQFGAQELLIILLIVVLLFGAKKLPETARGLGRSLRIFKAETKGLTDEDGSSSDDGGSSAQAPRPQVTAQHEPGPVSEAAAEQPTARADERQ